MKYKREVRCIVAGGRDFGDYELLEAVLDKHIMPTEEGVRLTIISGHAKGADKKGELYAINKALDLRLFPADWDKNGKGAGHIRNKEMAKYAAKKRGTLVAFWDGESKGTKNMIDLAFKHGLDVFVIKY